MGRFFWTLALLMTACLLATIGTSVVVFKQIDLTFTAFSIILVAPVTQSALLVWEADPPAQALGTAARMIVRLPLARPLLVIDAIVLTAGLAIWRAPAVGFGATPTVQPAWAAIKAGAAGLVLIAVARRPAWLSLACVALALSLVVLVFHDGFRAADVVAAALRLPGIAGRILVDGLAIAGTIGLALVCARDADRAGRTVTGTLLAAAAAFCIGGGVVDALAAFQYHELPQPWLGSLTICASLGASSLLLAAVTLVETP